MKGTTAKAAKGNNFIKAFVLGVLGSFFFAFNFILIRSMNLGGGYYLWTASLRYLCKR